MKNVTTFGKLFCLPLLLLLSINMYKTTTRNALARLGMGTIFLVVDNLKKKSYSFFFAPDETSILPQHVEQVESFGSAQARS